ncbi:MAG: alpha/beta hydrolase fold domain-containing protein [Pseudomonadota bacterium]
MAEFSRPGRLGDARLTAATDPRLDPRLREVIAAGAALSAAVEEPDPAAGYEAALRYCAAFEQLAASSHPLERAAMPERPDVVVHREQISSQDGAAITLYIHAPRERHGPLPAILHTHGGGMVLMSAADPGFERWRTELAHRGAVVVGVEFRNGGGALGNHPFPAGLTDCVAASQWLHEQRQALDLSAIVASGESGGGNLAIATTLAARAEGALARIDGVYAFCPYISGSYAQQPASLPSLEENADYVISNAAMTALVRVYDPQQEHGANPLAWPLQAGAEDLAGLPPHVISVNELDPLRDEGLAFYRKLLAAGVPATARTVHGTTHAGDLAFPDLVPDVYADSARSLLAFARDLAGGITAQA